MSAPVREGTFDPVGGAVRPFPQRRRAATLTSMTLVVRHRSPAQVVPARPVAPLRLRSARLGDRSCCCPAPPVYQVVLPTSGCDHIVEILLCGHHFRESRESLRARGAWIYDCEGNIVVPT